MHDTRAGSNVRTLAGGCHCGNIRYRLRWPLDDRNIPVRACSCSFCTKHRGTYTSHPDAALEATIADPAHLSRYRFGTETADFYICARCGAVPFVTSRIEGQLYAVVNVNTLEGVDASQLTASVADFSRERTDDRLARRQRTWIAKVAISGEGA